ncbi:serine/threonine-protein kinase [Polyangium aurulentum]|uniref:serine/threonine-protein kinase n=1 Tax=Polyangium aurulentum TaxID=2567896 RepID=UPI0010AE3707|nr:serine/threonine-protein kinase [Polyangium aurulentum]UQA58500.1 serine/threonine protein kinase [Polyangium aurulentum]
MNDSSPSLPQSVAPGELVAGKYRVERVIASGGMGVIVAAYHEGLGQRFAIKIMRPEILDNEVAVTRFLAEARTAARLQSDHVTRVFDVGRLEDGVPYMIMEYLDGSNLADLVDERGKLPVEEAVDFALQALEALAEAHAAGIVHRDLKPSNLVLTRRPDGSPHIKVIDFGISKHHGIDAPSGAGAITSTQQVLGSPSYMSPEQITSPKSVDMRADIWAMGVLLHELLTGTLPFEGETVGALMAQIISESPARLRELRPDAPAGLEKALRRCMERDPAARHRDVAELANALAPFGTRWAKLSAKRVESALRQSTLPDTSRGPGRTRRRRVMGMVAVVLCAGIVGVVAWLGLGRATPPASAASVPSSAIAASPVVVEEPPKTAPAALPPASPAAPAPSSASTPATRPAVVKATAPVSAKKKPPGNLLDDRQ